MALTRRYLTISKVPKVARRDELALMRKLSDTLPQTSFRITSNVTDNAALFLSCLETAMFRKTSSRADTIKAFLGGTDLA